MSRIVSPYKAADGTPLCHGDYVRIGFNPVFGQIRKLKSFARDVDAWRIKMPRPDTTYALPRLAEVDLPIIIVKPRGVIWSK